MPMSVMDIGHVIVRMFFGGVFMLVRMGSVHVRVIVSVWMVIMSVAVLVE